MTSLSCVELAELLPAVDRRELLPGAARRHLEQCLRCQAEAAGYRRMRRCLASLAQHPVAGQAEFGFDFAEVRAGRSRRLIRPPAARISLWPSPVPVAVSTVCRLLRLPRPVVARCRRGLAVVPAVRSKLRLSPASAAGRQSEVAPAPAANRRLGLPFPGSARDLRARHRRGLAVVPVVRSKLRLGGVPVDRVEAATVGSAAALASGIAIVAAARRALRVRYRLSSC